MLHTYYVLSFLITQSFFEYKSKIKFINHIKIIKEINFDSRCYSSTKNTTPTLFLLLGKERKREGRKERKEGEEGKEGNQRMTKINL